ncbi:hypothetical protein CANARDRAFT_175928 [[Candida] arabinofermentans NRRL YB-2248]|uniref:Mediator of RNA polymerase II transcription subunit 7 n=1 Tax=[Candida] arabinofermentans NRRL YB-2248 TaxID=983967 RepID=A0A1E4T134_9ASCO|nr:hypothetical protein CANARDRAFT_175928 [[Candida] arabinofermentans NRRL YB-2248]
MSEQQDDLISSLYPPPPPYIKFFTNENINKVKELVKEGTPLSTIASTKDLRFLIPPEPPSRPTYRSFGDIWNFEDKFITLEESGIEQLYDSLPKQVEEGEEIFTQERIEELKKMTKSLLLNFLEFIGLLAKNPALSYSKIEHIRIILINLHHLLNSYRLHQSREGLILKFEEKINEDLATIDKIEKTCENIENKIKMLVSDEIQFDVNSVKNDSKHATSTTTEAAITDESNATGITEEIKEDTTMINPDEEQEEEVADESTSLDNKDIEKLRKDAIKALIAGIE